MTADDFRLINQYLVSEPLNRLDRLLRPNEPIDRIYFPEGTVVSIVAIGPGGSRTEVGIFGREGMSGAAVLLGTEQTPLETYVQVGSSTSLSLPTATLLAATEASSTLRTLLLRYAHVQSVQVASALSTMAALTIERRLARWLLMCQDRLDGDDIALTHEFMGMMLGSRRAGVTEALHILEGNGLVRATRGLVIVINRAGLEALAGASYGLAENEYRRLIGAMPRDSTNGKLTGGISNASDAVA